MELVQTELVQTELMRMELIRTELMALVKIQQLKELKVFNSLKLSIILLMAVYY